MASHSQLKYGARLINSYLGNNATISCCEVLNSLIFPAHEQHHNNSFLCASLVMGQSNIAAGATIGSNHNSRSADGEIIAGRGFWPGLCVSLKHNSKFASFTIISKGDFPAELNIPLPFALVSNDVTNDRVVIMPGYWFMYNMYALERNAQKYIDRDKRIDKAQHIEYDYLAPDTISEILNALELFKQFTGKAYLQQQEPGVVFSVEEMKNTGTALLEKRNPIVDELEIVAEGFENTKRKSILIKTMQAYHLFKELVAAYAANEVMAFFANDKNADYAKLTKIIYSRNAITSWCNVGGQLIPSQQVQDLIKNIKKGKVNSWDDLHVFYKQQKDEYAVQKLNHAIAAYKLTWGINLKTAGEEALTDLLNNALATKEWMTRGIYESREKDYSNPFRQMVYDNEEEMNAVIGKLEDNSFIKQQNEVLRRFKKQANALKKRFTAKVPA